MVTGQEDLLVEAVVQTADRMAPTGARGCGT